MIRVGLGWHLLNIPPFIMFSKPFVLSFSLLLSLPILFLPVPTTPLPPPIPLSDELNDLSLFNRAASSSSSFSRLASPNPELKIAFLFLTNSDLPFSILWNSFFKKSGQDLYNIYVYTDPAANITLLGRVFKSKQISSKHTYRASPTLVPADCRLLATAIID